MRRIWIKDDIEKLADDFRNRMQTVQRFDGLLVHPLRRLQKLRNRFEEGRVLEYVGKDDYGRDSYSPIADVAFFIDYIQRIIDLYPGNLLTVKPSEIDELIGGFEGILPPERLAAILKVGGNGKKTFWEIVVGCMMYQEIRRWIFPEYIRKMELKSCVYCNANYAITDENGTAYYDLDHWKPKSRYPFLSTSFYNLQPCCHSCNMHKGNDDVHEYMGLYEDREGVPLNIFSLTVSDEDVANYIVSRDMSQIGIRFRPLRVQDAALCDDMNSQLHIESIYAEHRDVAANVIWRKRIYNDAFRKSMQPLFEDNNFTEDEIDRFILGTYFEDEDIHKRPLTKLMQDVFKTASV